MNSTKTLPPPLPFYLKLVFILLFRPFGESVFIDSHLPVQQEPGNLRLALRRHHEPVYEEAERSQGEAVQEVRLPQPNTIPTWLPPLPPPPPPPNQDRISLVT